MGQLTPEQELEVLRNENVRFKSENSTLKAANESLTADNKKIGIELSTSKTLVGELSEALETATKTNKNAKPSATYKKTTYDIVHGITHENKLYSPADIAANTDLVKKLVESGSSAVREQITD